jgi:hypothetical protein
MWMEDRARPVRRQHAGRITDAFGDNLKREVPAFPNQRHNSSCHSSGTSLSNTSASDAVNTGQNSPVSAAFAFHLRTCAQVEGLVLWRGLPGPHSILIARAGVLTAA